jgi:hypothetical protein
MARAEKLVRYGLKTYETINAPKWVAGGGPGGRGGAAFLTPGVRGAEAPGPRSGGAGGAPPRTA